MKKMMVLLLSVAVLCSGCALAAGTAVGGLTGVVVGSSLEGGKADTSTSCPSCQKLPNGMTRAEYEQQLRRQYMEGQQTTSSGRQ